MAGLSSFDRENPCEVTAAPASARSPVDARQSLALLWSLLSRRLQGQDQDERRLSGDTSPYPRAPGSRLSGVRVTCPSSAHLADGDPMCLGTRLAMGALRTPGESRPLTSL